MINVKDLEHVISLVLASSYLEGVKPLSALLVSDRPESGKTKMITKFRSSDGVVVLSDCTAYALWRDFGTRLAQGEIKHLIIPEFLAPLSRGQQTVESFLSTLQMMMEEGLEEIHTGYLEPIKFDSPIIVGVIACMPRDAFEKNKLNWMASGFLSRFKIITYKYSEKTVDAILDNIMNNYSAVEEEIELKFPEKKAKIEIPKDVAKACRALSTELSEELRTKRALYGFRELKNILTLVASETLLDIVQNKSCRVQSTMKDFEKIYELSYLFNTEFNSLRR